MLEANLELPVDGICSLTVPYISVCNLRSDIRHGLITEAWNQAELPTRRNVTLPNFKASNFFLPLLTRSFTSRPTQENAIYLS
ncbi:uncharacterized protein PADG_11691 [Paracoccidioides brasiliensis Pb18]|uniref:Uncharacterized protein n=2 Tax=Paracoccidioides brasiliensis TaxID=121759 RepID=A0A0A0HSH0_PARBD|nr:uncharacterized protein PADG_11691 [Paracoccidioides brasiliensis Pb18]KGM92154.1 hypothetical protein PADG_11691 [Paracoccidioides brasiliensis Pb18]ODH41298.1 hypothetical protein ACO22_01431 [Paracoccidioides brasiliensis]ODH47375.1 hypothetical protein GX48_06547 [Paracoccidioides brasiliensis]